MDIHRAGPSRLASPCAHPHGLPWRRPALLIALLAILAVSAPSGLSAAVVAVSIKDYAFDPQAITVDIGDTVTWTNNDGIAHAVTSASGAYPQLALSGGSSGSWLITTSGDIPYYCALHPTLMSGVIHSQGPTPAVITSAPPWDGVQNLPYAYHVTASGQTPITYTVTAGALPAGLTMDGNGLISGTPTTTGLSTGDITATNSLPPASIQHFAITISAFPAAPTIVSPPPPAGTAQALYTYSYAATGSGPITYTLTTGALPPGLTLSTIGVLSGTPTTSSTFAYTGTVTASNGTAPDSSQSFSILIAAGGGGGGGYVPPVKDCGSGAKVVLLLLSGLVLLRRFRS